MATMKHKRPIDPAMHAVLDYLTVGIFVAMGLAYRRRNPRASALAFANAGMVLGASLLTDYPGGVLRQLTFEQHGKLDAMQAGLSALGPRLLGFASSPDARPFYAQAGLEAGIISQTDWRPSDTLAEPSSSGRDRGRTIYHNTPTASADAEQQQVSGNS
jgi:hypothetical protein